MESMSQDQRHRSAAGVRTRAAPHRLRALMELSAAGAVAFGMTWLTAGWTFGAGAVIQPTAGLALAAFVLGRAPLWPGLYLGTALALGAVGGHPLGAVASAGGLILAGAATRPLLARRGFDAGLCRLTDVSGLGLNGALVGGAIFAAAQLGVCAIQGMAPGKWLVTALSNLMAYGAGVLTIGALVLAWARPGAGLRTLAGRAHLTALVLAVLLLSGLVFLQPPGFLRTWHLYPLLVWAALAFNARGAALAVTCLSLCAVLGAAAGLGPNAFEAPTTRLLLAQHMVLVTAATTLVLAAAADERRLTRRLQEAQDAAEAELSQRRRVEVHQQLLINELNHRVKNTLATIQSMTVQTLRGTRDCDAAAEALTERIVALSLAHDVLTRQNWEGAEVADIVSAAVAPFDASRATRFGWRGPPVKLPPGMALGLAMALHELATNAAKHGALRSTDGRVAIDWLVEADDGGKVLMLDWTEREGPAVSPPTRRGFGSRLLERGLPAQLNGTVELAFAPQGLSCHVRARLPAVATTEVGPGVADLAGGTDVDTSWRGAGDVAIP